MPRQLFIRVEPRALERYTKQEVPRRRRMPQSKINNLTILKRALQAIPPRELQMLHTVRVLGVEQDEACKIYNVRQSNISYRLERAGDRIALYNELVSIVSETVLRRKLFDLGLGESTVRAVTGVIKTTSQSATAKALRISQGSVRHIFATALSKLDSEAPGSPEQRLLLLVEQNYSKLRAIDTQERWVGKVRGGNYTTKTTPVEVPEVSESE
jgi:predicted DNA-binding protein (UPF0251 family)